MQSGNGLGRGLREAGGGHPPMIHAHCDVGTWFPTAMSQILPEKALRPGLLCIDEQDTAPPWVLRCLRKSSER